MELDFARIDPELAAALEQLPPNFGRIDRDNLDKVRQVMAEQRPAPTPSDLDIQRRSVPGPDGEVPVIIYRRASTERQPCLLWIHGGPMGVGLHRGFPCVDRPQPLR